MQTKSFARFLPPIMGLAILSLMWWLAVISFVEIDVAAGINNSWMVASPIQIFEYITKPEHLMLAHSFHTLSVALSGLILGILIGGILGILFLLSTNIKQCFYPLVVAFRSIPIVTFTYLVTTWSDATIWGNIPWAHVLLTSAIVLGPITMAFVEGNETIPSSRIRLFELYGASRWKNLWMLQLPSIVSELFSALKLSVSLAVVGAVIAEMGGGGEDIGLGITLLKASSPIDVPANFAVIVCCVILALLLYGIVALIQARVQPLYLEDNSGVRYREE